MHAEGQAYRLIRELGRGGMGVVYEAWDARLDRRVALKVLYPNFLVGAGGAERVEREARLAARVEHPNVVRVYRVDSLDGQLVIEMEYISGHPLYALLANGPMPVAHAVKLLEQVLEALAACHRQGIVHCDLKPGNLLVTATGRVYLTDFGIARASFTCGDISSPSHTRTATEGRWGTPRYSAPEAWTDGAVTPAWDLYSAGLVIREAILGQPAFEARTAEMLLRMKLDGELTPLRALRLDLSGGLASLLDAMVARRVEDRPADAEEALRQLRETPEYRERDNCTEPLSKPAVSSPPLLGLDASLLPPSLAPAKPPAPLGKRIVAACIVFFLAALLGVGIWYGLDSWRRPAGLDVAALRLRHEPRNLVASGPKSERAYFTYDDGVHGEELWQVTHNDKPRLVADLAPGMESSTPRNLTMHGMDAIYFAATTPQYGEELWAATTNGVGNTAVRLRMDVFPGTASSEATPTSMTDAGMLFSARTPRFGRELWIAGPEECVMLSDFYAGAADSVVMLPAVRTVPWGFYVFANNDYRKAISFVDLTNNTMERVVTFHTEGTFAVLGDVLIFSDAPVNDVSSLWSIRRGDKAPTRISPKGEDAKGFNADHFFLWNDRIIFQARTLEAGMELWSTDGTAEGTRLIADINPGPADSNPYHFVSAADRLFFRAFDDRHGRELWQTQGTAESTSIVFDAWPGQSSGEPYNMTSLKSHFFFTVNDGVHGEELWVLDAAEALLSPYLAADLVPGRESSEPHGLIWWGESSGIMIARDIDGFHRPVRVFVNGTNVWCQPHLTLPRGAASDAESQP